MTTCPRCNIALTMAEYESIPVEACARCKGHWVDAEQLREIVHTHDRTWDREALAAAQRSTGRMVPLKEVREFLPCPSCRATMETFNYSGDSGIILDRCRHCRGIWLDGGELEKVQILVEASEQNLDTDIKRFGGTLREVEAQEDLAEQRDNRSTNAPLFTALFTRMLDID